MISESPALKGRPYRFPARCLLLSALLAACAGLREREEPLPEISVEPTVQPMAEPPAGPAAAAEAESPGAVPAYDEKDHPLPGNLRFVPAPLPRLRLPPGVGTVRREPEDPSREAALRALEESFKTGYIDALLRDTPLAGVLGGDFVHGWPPEEPAAWVQNWRSAEPEPNSWGLPSLVLGLRGIEGDRVFTVTGPILDAYGRGEGLNGANGAAGYGAPRGDPFPLGRGFAQRFDRGLFILEPPEKPVFIPGKAPSAVLPCPPQTGSFPEGSPAERERIREAFRSAWRIAIDARYGSPELAADLSDSSDPAGPGGPSNPAESSDPSDPSDPAGPAGPAARGRAAETPGPIPPLRPDGEVVYCPLSPVPRAGAGEEALRTGGLYIQLFEGASIIFLLADSPALPAHVRVIKPPFTEALLASGRRRLPGAETPAEEFPDAREDDTTWLGALLRGLALYGIPLTDELPRREEGVYRGAQRFSRGWMIPEESKTPELSALNPGISD